MHKQFSQSAIPNDLDLLQTPNTMQMTRITLQPIRCVSRYFSMLTINIYKQALCTCKIKFTKIRMSSTNIIFDHASHLNLANESRPNRTLPTFYQKTYPDRFNKLSKLKTKSDPKNQKITKHSNNRRSRRKQKTVHLNDTNINIQRDVIYKYIYTYIHT